MSDSFSPSSLHFAALSAGLTAVCAGGGGGGGTGAGALSVGLPKTCRVPLHNVRVTDVKGGGGGEPR